MQFLFRPIRVFLALLPFLVSFLRDWQGWVLFGPPRRLTEDEHRRRARRLTATLAKLGPAFVKAAQVLATREDIVPRLYTDELKTLQDRVPPFPVREVYRTIEQSLGRPVEALFDSFDPEPLAAASLGQVHRAIHAGRPVAVKVLRPRVERLVELDLSVVGFILRVFAFFVDSHIVRSFLTIHQEYMRVIRIEMDFRNEEKHADRLRRNFASNPRVVIPKCRTELTTRRTVAFDFVEGVRVDDPAALAEIGMTPKELVDLLIEIYVRMAIVHGFIHADPHPGNLLVDRQRRVVILDYGMVLDFPDRLRLELLRGCLAVVRNDIDTLVDSFYKIGMVDPEINRSLVRDAAETLLRIQLRDDFTPRMVQEIANDILDTFHQFPLRMPQQLVYLFRASALIEGLGMKYDANFSAVREATPVIKRLVREIALEGDAKLPFKLRDFGKSAFATIRQLQRVVERMEREEQHLRLHQGDLADIRQAVWSSTRRLILSMGSIAWFLAGLFLSIELDSPWPFALLAPPSMLVLLVAAGTPLRRRSRWW